MAVRVEETAVSHSLIQLAVGVVRALKADCGVEWWKMNSYYSTIAPHSLSVKWVVVVVTRQY